jgi:anaerobic ribonucleoside-triphosphate reductase
MMTTPTTKEKLIGADIKFTRTRRITGYLVGSLDRFNNAKRHEERDRVKHG